MDDTKRWFDGYAVIFIKSDPWLIDLCAKAKTRRVGFHEAEDEAGEGGGMGGRGKGRGGVEEGIKRGKGEGGGKHGEGGGGGDEDEK